MKTMYWFIDAGKGAALPPSFVVTSVSVGISCRDKKHLADLRALAAGDSRFYFSIRGLDSTRFVVQLCKEYAVTLRSLPISALHALYKSCFPCLRNKPSENVSPYSFFRR